MPLDFSGLNGWAVLVAVVLFMGLGALWYAPFLFGQAWMAGAGLTPEDIAAAGARPYIFGIVLGLVTAVVLSALLAGAGVASAAGGLGAGLLLGAGLVAPLVATIHAFETRPASLVAIDAGFAVVALGVMGALLGAWR